MSNLALLILLMMFGCQSNHGIKVTFKIHAPSTDDTTNIFVAGNTPQMGNWWPDKVMLHYSGDHVWRRDFKFQKGTVLEYKITLGSYDNEAADASGKPFQNSILTVTNDTTIHTTIIFWKKGSDFKVKGQITGEVQYHRQIDADSLLPRDIIVWLPPGYQENAPQRYPVLYVHDGQNIVDPQTAAFKVDWQLDETADSLIRKEVIKPLIVVGIYNTGRRSQEYTPTSEGALYRTFVIDKVKSLIDQTYRTKPGREYTAVGGSSAGGLVAFMLAWEHPEVFSKAICLSPAFKIMEIDYVKNVQAYKTNKKDIQVYIYNGGLGVEAQLLPGIKDMMKSLKNKGFQEGQDYFWFRDDSAGHFEAAWAAQMPAVLKLFYGFN